MSTDYNWVTPRLATGAAITSADDAKEIGLAGVTHIVDVTDAEDDGPLFVSVPGITVLWNPVADDGNPSTHGDAWFGKSLAFALTALAQPRHRVYAHCSAGVNRGPSTAFAIMLALGWDAAVAEQLIRTARPQVGLAYKEEAVASVASLGYR